MLLGREITVGGIQAVKCRKLMQMWKTQLVPGVGRCLQSGFLGTWWAGNSWKGSTRDTVRLAHSYHHAACPTRSAQFFGNGSLPLSQLTSGQPEHSPENLVWLPEHPALWQQGL